MSLVPYRDNPEKVDFLDNDPPPTRPLRDDAEVVDPSNEPTQPYRDDPDYEPQSNEQFEDEPGSEYGDAPAESSSSAPRRSASSKPKKAKGSKKKKGKGKSSSSRKNDRGGTVPYTGGGGPSGGENGDEPRHKYSTANQKETGRWKRLCWLFLMFLLIILFMIAINMLMQHFFFSDKSDNTDMSEFVRNPNSTFPLEKRDVDSACSRGSLAADEGASCRNACLPVYYECCDPFNSFVLYDNYNTLPPSNTTSEPDDDTYQGGLDQSDYGHRTNASQSPSISAAANSSGNFSGGELNRTTPPTSSPTKFKAPLNAPSQSPSTQIRRHIRRFLRSIVTNNDIMDVEDEDESEDRSLDEIQIPITVAPVWWNDHKEKMDDAIKASENQTCTLDNELQGCMRYAKCQAVTGKINPAPATLADMCNTTNLRKDPQSCRSVCFEAQCCYANDATNCQAEHFDRCLDYAACQNLRALVDDNIIPTAPRTLDEDCLYQQQGCLDSCLIAECCGDRANSCFANNFISCLTYAPCNNQTRTNIHVPVQFNTVPEPPDEILEACGESTDAVLILEPSSKSCNEICQASSCCRERNADANCFIDDPLGCLVWNSQCTGREY